MRGSGFSEYNEEGRGRQAEYSVRVGGKAFLIDRMLK
jgi:hypothetical protein